MGEAWAPSVYLSNYQVNNVRVYEEGSVTATYLVVYNPL